MMNFGVTEEPMQISPTADDGYVIYSTEDSFIPLAHVFVNDGFESGAKATALMMAAAPEMLEALQHAVRWHAGSLGFCNCAWCRPMKKAIAKATIAYQVIADMVHNQRRPDAEGEAGHAVG